MIQYPWCNLLEVFEVRPPSEGRRQNEVTHAGDSQLLGKFRGTKECAERNENSANTKYGGSPKGPFDSVGRQQPNSASLADPAGDELSGQPPALLVELKMGDRALIGDDRRNVPASPVAQQQLGERRRLTQH
jgi:hypothetical protein